MRARTRLGASGLVAALLLAVMTVLAGPAQAATPAVKISKIYYNSPGADTGSNSSMNAEYVTLQNTTTTARTITGWTVRDASGHVYKFPATTIGAKSTITLRSGSGTNSTTTRYWQQRWYVWNNTGGERAELRSPTGTLVHSCSYTGTSTSYTNCA
jgi:hypothetical protein